MNFFRQLTPQRKTVRAKPTSQSDASPSVTSSTAKRILDTLERMSTPLSVSVAKVNVAEGAADARLFPSLSRSHSSAGGKDCCAQTIWFERGSSGGLRLTSRYCVFLQDAKKIPSYNSNDLDSSLSFTVS